MICPHRGNWTRHLAWADEGFWNAATGTVGVQRGTRIILINGLPDRATAGALITRAANHLP